MSASELIRQMVQAHVEHDETLFRTAAEKLIEEERRKNHHTYARTIEKILFSEHAVCSKADFSLFQFPTLPMDKEKTALLVEFREPRKTFDDLILGQTTIEHLEQIVLENRKADLLQSRGITPSRKILLCGPPGCGKTISAEAIAGYLYLPLFVVRFDSVVSSYLGETASNLRKVFDFAKSTPMVILFDEFDAIGKCRSLESEHGELKRVINSFLQMLDGFYSETVMIASTNHEGLLDSALWRRFDDIILMERPDREQIERLLVKVLNQVGVPNKKILRQSVSMLFGLSHADVERAALDAIKHMILDGDSVMPTSTLLTAISKQVERSQLVSSAQANLGRGRNIE